MEKKAKTNNKMISLTKYDVCYSSVPQTSAVTQKLINIYDIILYLWQSLCCCSFPGRCCLCWVCNTRTSPDLQPGASGSPAGPCPLSPSPPSPPRSSPGPGTGRKGSPCPWWTPLPSASHQHHPCTGTTQSPAYVGLHTLTQHRAGRGGTLQRGTGVQLEALHHDTQRTGALWKEKKWRDRKRKTVMSDHEREETITVSLSVGHSLASQDVWCMDSPINILSWWPANRESIH